MKENKDCRYCANYISNGVTHIYTRDDTVDFELWEV